jgi:hypothetical protein
MTYPMWNQARTGILIDRGEGVLAFVESGPEFDALKNTSPDWHEYPISRPTPIPATQGDVAQERDRRLALDFDFQGKLYQRDRVSVQRIAGAAQMASLAIAQGAQAGDLHWHGGEPPFGWIASDDSVTHMDAQTVVQFGIAAAGVETAIIFAARALRQMETIPQDFTDDKYWP